MNMAITTVAEVQYEMNMKNYNPIIKTSTFEKNGGTYQLVNEVLIPNLTVGRQSQTEIGIYGRKRKQYLKMNKPEEYSALIIEGELLTHLVNIEKQAQQLLKIETPRLMKAWKVNEEMKKTNQMKWVGLMNNIKSTIEESIYNEIIYK